MIRQKFAIKFPFFYSYLLNLSRKLMNYTTKEIYRCISSETINVNTTKTIVFFIHWFNPSGAEYYALECAKIAKDMGYKIIWIVEFDSINQNWKRMFENISQNIYYLFKLNHNINSNDWLKNLILKYKPVAIHIHHSYFAYQHIEYIKNIFPCIVTIDSTHIIEIKNGGFPAMSLTAKNHIDFRNVISEGLKKYFLNHGILENKIVRSNIIPDIIDSKFIKPDFNKNIFRIGFVGRLSEQKRPYLIIPFIKKLESYFNNLKQQPNIEIIIYGNGEYYKDMLEALNKLKTSIKINILTNCYDKNEIYTNLHCVIQLSENEGISLVSYETILYKVPLFCTNVGQQKEIINNIFLLSDHPRKSLNEVVIKIIELYNNPKFFEASLLEQYNNLLEIDKKFGYKKIVKNLYLSLKEDIVI